MKIDVGRFLLAAFMFILVLFGEGMKLRSYSMYAVCGLLIAYNLYASAESGVRFFLNTELLLVFLFLIFSGISYIWAMNPSLSLYRFKILTFLTVLVFMVTNQMYREACVKTYLILLNPVAPHITEELWELCGFGGRISEQSWPSYDEALVKEDTVEIGVQVSGKLRGTVRLSQDEDKDSALAKAKEVESVAAAIAGKTIVKEIYVPGKIVNIVVK